MELERGLNGLFELCGRAGRHSFGIRHGAGYTCPGAAEVCLFGHIPRGNPGRRGHAPHRREDARRETLRRVDAHRRLETWMFPH